MAPTSPPTWVRRALLTTSDPELAAGVEEGPRRCPPLARQRTIQPGAQPDDDRPEQQPDAATNQRAQLTARSSLASMIAPLCAAPAARAEQNPSVDRWMSPPTRVRSLGPSLPSLGSMWCGRPARWSVRGPRPSMLPTTYSAGACKPGYCTGIRDCAPRAAAASTIAAAETVQTSTWRRRALSSRVST